MILANDHDIISLEIFADDQRIRLTIVSASIRNILHFTNSILIKVTAIQIHKAVSSSQGRQLSTISCALPSNNGLLRDTEG